MSQTHLQIISLIFVDCKLWLFGMIYDESLLSMIIFDWDNYLCLNISVDCDFENTTCDWTLVTDNSLHLRSIFKDQNICGFHGSILNCVWVFDGAIYTHFNWMIVKLSNITDRIFEVTNNLQFRLSIGQLQNTLSKGN